MNNYLWIMIAVLYIVSTHLVGHYIGTKREIGYGKSILWSLSLTPIIGFIRTLLSTPIRNK